MSAPRRTVLAGRVSRWFHPARVDRVAHGLALAASVGIAAIGLATIALADGVLGVAAPPSRVADILRKAELRTLRGELVSATSRQGEVVVLTFWASWCAPCRREMPRLDALHAEIMNKGGRVLAVSVDEERRNVERFVQRLRLELPVVHDGPDGLAHALDLRRLPLTLVLDREGRVAFTSHRTDEAGMNALADATRRLLEGRAVATRPARRETP